MSDIRLLIGLELEQVHFRRSAHTIQHTYEVFQLSEEDGMGSIFGDEVGGLGQAKI